MGALLRFGPLLLGLALLIYALIDAARTPEDEVRNLPRPVWILLIVLVPTFVGPIAWLVAGRPRRDVPVTGGLAASGPAPWPAPRAGLRRPAPRPLAPDDDPEFLASLGRDGGGPVTPPDKDATPPRPEDDDGPADAPGEA